MSTLYLAMSAQMGTFWIEMTDWKCLRTVLPNHRSDSASPHKGLVCHGTACGRRPRSGPRSTWCPRTLLTQFGTPRRLCSLFLF